MPNLLSILNAICNVALPDVEFKYLQLDSRKVDQHTIFVALPGLHVDGRDYIHQAIKQGAVAVLAEADADNAHGRVKTFNAVQIIYIEQLSQLQHELAKRCMPNSLPALQLIGVTGTNGKTSIADMVYQCLIHLQEKAAYVGTLGIKTPDGESELNNTTPVAIDLYNTLAKIHTQGSQVCALEISSHALAEKRVHGLEFLVSAFSNLSHDHLDYHGDMQAYYEAKKALFTQYPAQFFVINVDNTWGARLVKELTEEFAERAHFNKNSIVQVGCEPTLTQHANFVQASNIRVLPHGFTFSVKTRSDFAECRLNLLGHFNIENALIVIGILLAKGFELAAVIKAIESVNAIKGRMETFYQNDKPLLVVDFAHTPDGLEQALKACRQHLASNHNRLNVVFGCGGNRDINKRASMGRIAEQYADRIYITNDNARGEDPLAIASAILQGISNHEQVDVELDRKTAIQRAYQQAKPGDVVLIAGKGHEITQEIGSEKIRYDERAYVQQLMERVA